MENISLAVMADITSAIVEYESMLLPQADAGFLDAIVRLIHR